MEKFFSSSEEGPRARAIDLFSYLRELVQLRSKAEISCDRYERLIWLTEFPEDELCRWIYRAPLEKLHEGNALVGISKPHFENPPALQAIYAELFSIYQTQQKLDEAYEVVLAIGLLRWKTATGRFLKRHILTAQTNIMFETNSGRLRLEPAAEGASLRFELDMLAPLEQPEPAVQKAFEAELAEIGDNLTGASALKMILAKWIDSFHPQGQFVESFSPESEISHQPLLCFAPAIILRKRPERMLLSACSEIIEQLAAGTEIPDGVKGLVEINGSAPRNDTPNENETWFPLPANDEQKEIVRRLERQHGVVVQAPPGTGKSHAIANLVCHLLATGKRILVTAHTSRALRVLKQKIPDQIAALCVHVLGNEREAMQELENSVQALAQQRALWPREKVKSHMSALAIKLSELRKESAQVLQRGRTRRESETRQYSNLFGNYSGDLPALAERLQSEEHFYDWLPDIPGENQEPPLTNDELNRLHRLLREIPENEYLTGTGFSAPADLLAPREFYKLTYAEQSAQKKFSQYGINRDNADFRALLACNAETRDDLRRSVALISGLVDRLQQAPEAWVRKALADVMAGRITVWQRLGHDTHASLKQAHKLMKAVRNITVEGVESRHPQLKADAARLLAHLRNGGGLGLGPFKRRVVKECDYLTRHLFVNGRPCNSANELQYLVQYLELQEILQRLHDEWRHLVYVNQNASLRLQLAEFKDHLKALAKVLFLHSSLEEAKQFALLALNNREPDWRDLEALHELRDCLAAVEAGLDYYDAQRPFKKLENQILHELRSAAGHPVMNSLLLAVKRRDYAGYGANLQRLNEIAEIEKLTEEKTFLLEKLRRHAPVLARQLASHFKDENWTAKLQNFAAAWNWARANRWLKSAVHGEEQSDPGENSELLAQAISKTIAELAALKAWECCLQHMTPHEEQHLVAWKKALEKIDGGNGKYAGVYRQEARAHLEQCRSAMPVWIMPIFRVAETFRPRSGLFDVAIIDEASQAGPEALLLMYCAKKIIVVGDGQHLSPDFSGVNKEDVLRLRHKYLQEIPHNDFLDVDSSFFDYAEIQYPKLVRLKEHSHQSSEEAIASPWKKLEEIESRPSEDVTIK